MMLSWFFILTLWEASLALTSLQANNYMDQVLADSNFRYQEAGSYIDPAPLANFANSTSTKLYALKADAKFNYTNGIMKGLFRVKRYGDCVIFQNNNSFSCYLSFPNINVSYDGKLKYGVLPTKSIKAYAYIYSTLGYINVLPPTNSGGSAKVNAARVGNVQTEFTGLGQLNSQVKKLAENAFVAKITEQLRQFFEIQLSAALSRACARISAPK
ncbi:uncharacterized protein LOC111633357 [Centruroides sculpturatus]|uniref:uncharacterized protein LOC111633357 n=1 Tax=Centruroides sculpturatus TaxID=218467 RepID=UPI000C6CF00C|nr:uncharacterized protein LOC111633357 [Centruroides sculpturatus]